MHIRKIALLLALSSLATSASLDVSKGTDIIPPDSEEAHKLSKSDKAVKTAPKDNSYVDGMESEKFKKPEPKVNNQNLDVPDTESLTDTKEVSVQSDDDHYPVVLNDYDPNNLGVPADKVSEKEGKDKPKVKGKPTTKKGGKKEDEKKNENDGTTSSSKPVTGTTGSDTGAVDTSDKNTNVNTDTNTNSNTNSDANSNNDKINTKTNANSEDSHKTYGTVGTSPFHSFTMAGSMIIFSEIGDKTFLIAALMAMKHPRLTVFTSAFASLVIMTILSAIMGHALPALLPKKLTSILAATLFIIFGIKLLREGLAMDSSLGVEEELEEVETEIEAKEFTLRNDELESGTRKEMSDLRRSSSSPQVYDDGLEKGTSEIPFYNTRSHTRSLSTWKQFVEGVNNLASLVLSPIWVQVFVMTFLGEWGDRSQVATIAMAAGSDYWFVILGAILGHGLCTLTAVVGGKLLASKISMRQITLAGAASFVVFSIVYFYEGFSLSWSD